MRALNHDPRKRYRKTTTIVLALVALTSLSATRFVDAVNEDASIASSTRETRDYIEEDRSTEASSRSVTRSPIIVVPDDAEWTFEVPEITVVLPPPPPPAPEPEPAPTPEEKQKPVEEKPSAPVAAVPVNESQQIAHDMLVQRGLGEDEFSCLVSLWTKESGWRVDAANASSGAYGIPQALPGSKMASAGSDWQTNPATQITWGLGYIEGRYGTPCGAWSAFQSKGWY